MMKKLLAHPKNRTLWRTGFNGVSLVVTVAMIRWTESFLLGFLCVEISYRMKEWLFPRPAVVREGFKFPGSKKQRLAMAVAACFTSLVFLLACVEYPEHSAEMTKWMQLTLVALGLAFGAYVLRWSLNRSGVTNKEA